MAMACNWFVNGSVWAIHSAAERVAWCGRVTQTNCHLKSQSESIPGLVYAVSLVIRLEDLDNVSLSQKHTSLRALRQARVSLTCCCLAEYLSSCL